MGLGSRLKAFPLQGTMEFGGLDNGVSEDLPKASRDLIIGSLRGPGPGP